MSSLMDAGFVPLDSLTNKPAIDLAKLRRKLASGNGPAFWRTLEEADSTEEAAALLDDEFPSVRGSNLGAIDRRNLLKVMGASLAMAGAAACTRQPPEYIVPYVRQPENIVPGLPLFYATAAPINGYGRGLLVESHLNRPTKIEGNPDHPGSLGSTGIFEQASILSLYDPDRSPSVLKQGRLSDFGHFQEALAGEKRNLAQRQGEGLAILTTTFTSPTLLAQMRRVQSQFPRARFYTHHAGGSLAAANAAKAIAGKPASIIYDLSKADVVVSLESDFLIAQAGSLAYSRHTAARRAVDNGVKPWRFYAIESSPSVTGSIADHRFPYQAAKIPALAYQLASACGANAPAASGQAPQWMKAIVQDLQAAPKGRTVVIPGEYQPESVHRAAFAINQALGNIGSTVKIIESPEGDLPMAPIEQLVGDLNSGQVEVLMMLGGNPVYDAPGSLQFSSAMSHARFIAHLSAYYNETSQFAHWHIPEAHFLETWGDVRAFDGTVTIQQPLIAALYGGKTAAEVLANVGTQQDTGAHDLVKGYWRNIYTGSGFEEFWETAVHDGIVPGTVLSELKPTGTSVELPALTAAGEGLEVVFRPDPTVGNGEWANNAWLQELPKPQNKLCWDNTIWMSPKTAGDLKVKSEEVAKITVGSQTIEGPVWILPGHVNNSITVQFGYGRQSGGRVAEKIGYNAYPLQNAASPFVTAGSLKGTGKRFELANTQATQTMEEREPVRIASYEKFLEDPAFPTEEEKPLAADDTLYPAYKYDGYKWGMVIDLNVCTGCSACSIACQAENNIAVVGKDQVSRGRHMHWIRIDQYYHGDLDHPVSYNQPVPCMHCENAPCELVCPVAATVHSGEGLNQMVYNRCVGTRYCSNNCPYKVRRFNFYLYADWQTPSLHGLRNPDVTVRSRGVMEKCSYCVQRIQEAKITSEKENRQIRDGEVVTACSQVCPTQAITFGDLNDKTSKVAKQAANKRNYGLLDDLNTRPRTTYLGYVRNQNPALGGEHGNREA